jgi:phenylacetate-CoA ligase
MLLTPLDPWIAGRIAGSGAATTGSGATTARPGAATAAPGVTVADAAGSAGTVDRGALERWQVERLAATVEHAATNGPAWRRRLAHLGPPTGIVRSLDDLRRLPFTTADDLRAAPAGYVCVPQDDIGRIVTLDTSGTSGAPKRIWFTRDDQALTVDFFGAGMSVFTRPGDRVLILLPGETPGSVGDLLADGLRRIGAEPVKHGPVRDPRATLAVAARERVSVMVGIPTHLLRLARCLPEPAALPDLRAVLLSTDHVPQSVIDALTGAWGCAVYNHWGMTETGLGGGVDCEIRHGYHLREADLLCEVVDPDTGEPVADGGEGELVVTTLTRRGMPVLRYRTGDLARWLPERCFCSTALRTLAHITTRVTGRIPLGDGVLTQAALDEAVFRVDDVIDFGARLERPGGEPGSARLVVRVETAAHARRGLVRAGVLDALQDVDAVGRAWSAGTLADVRVEVVAERLAPPTPRKRSIEVVEG